jgi:beta-lactamase regulating signal transducer with metallopeptidase domain
MNALHTLLAAPWVEPLGRTLLHFLWQGAVLGALAWVALRLAHKRSASLRYLVAGLLMLALAVAPIVTFLILANTTPAPAPRATEALAQPTNGPALSTPTLAPASLALPNAGYPPPSTLGQPNVSTTSTPHIPSAPIAHPFPWLTGFLAVASRWMVPFWVIGVLAMGARLGLGWLRIQFWRRSATPTVDPALLASFRRLAGKFNLGTKIRLLISGTVPGPVTLGWVRPAVLLPAQMLTGLPPDLLEALLAHELAHIARQDYLVNLVQSAIEVGLFYHPAVWWLGARLREIREECCDELAVQACGDRLTYARALASLAQLQLAPELAAAATGGNLLARITRIAGRTPAAAGSSAMGTFLFLMVSVGLIACWPSSPIKAQDQTPSATPSQTQVANKTAEASTTSIKETQPEPNNPIGKVDHNTDPTSQINQIEVEASFVEYPSALKFDPPSENDEVHGYIDKLQHMPGMKVLDAPKITILAGKEASINVLQQGAKMDGTNYFAMPIGVSLTLTPRWADGKIEYSGKESLTILEKASSTNQSLVQDADMTEMILHGTTTPGKFNIFYLGEGNTPGISRATILVFNDIKPTPYKATTPPAGTVYHSPPADTDTNNTFDAFGDPFAPTPSQNPSASALNGTLNFNGPVPPPITTNTLTNSGVSTSAFALTKNGTGMLNLSSNNVPASFSTPSVGSLTFTGTLAGPPPAPAPAQHNLYDYEGTFEDGAPAPTPAQNSSGSAMNGTLNFNSTNILNLDQVTETAGAVTYKQPHMVEIHAIYLDSFPIIHTDALTGKVIGDGSGYPLIWYPDGKKTMDSMKNPDVDVSSLQIRMSPAPWDYGKSFTGTSAVEDNSTDKKTEQGN